MRAVLHLFPVALAAIGWYGLHKLNASKRWFRVGEVVFWDVVMLILVFLIWLRWF